MHEKKEEQSIEEYWGLFRDSLPGAESAVEATYRILEVLNRQVDTFSEIDRKDRYPKLTTERDRNQNWWKLNLTFWSHTSDEWVTLTAMGKIYSRVVADLFSKVSNNLKEESELRLTWVKQSERELAELKDSLRKTEKFCSSLGT
jgi:hypothetical protein